MQMRPFVLILCVALAACAGRPKPVATVAIAAPAPVDDTPTATPINAGLTPAASLWHLRAGLNVAALACRGPEEGTLIARYNTLLSAHAAALAAAEASYQASYRAQGGEWRDRYDDHQTRLYNFFSQAYGRNALCAAAGTTLAGLDGVSDADLTTRAGERLAVLDRAFVPPRLEVDPRVFATPERVMVASR